MKRITIVSLVILGLILWGLKLSPQFSQTSLRVVSEKAESVLNKLKLKKPEPVQLPESLAKQKEKFETLMLELDQLKKNYNATLTEYKKMDKEFTALVLKSRKNPNPELVKIKQIELDKKFEDLTASLKGFQEKSKAIYTFQSSNI